MMYKPTHRITREMIGCFDRTRIITVGTEVMVDDEYPRPCSDCVNARFEPDGELFAVPASALEKLPDDPWADVFPPTE